MKGGIDLHNSFIKKCIFSVVLLLSIFSFDILLCEKIYGQFYYNIPILQITFYLFVISFVFIFKSNLYSLIYSCVFTLIYSLLIFANILMHISSNDIFSVKYFSMIFTAFEVAGSSYIPWSLIGIYLLYYIIIFGIYFIIYKFVNIKYGSSEYSLDYIPQIISAFLIILGLFFNLISISTVEKKYSNYNLYDDMTGLEIISFKSNTSKKDSLKSFGLFSYFFGELSHNDLSSLKKDDEPPYPNISDNITEEPIVNDKELNFENYNVITIMIETGAYFLLNEYLTPNLYSLIDDGINFTNCYSKNKTNVSEFIEITGSGADMSLVQKGTLKNKYSIVSLLNEKGYYTQYFHDNTQTFYNRDKEMENLEFQRCYFADEVNPEVIEYNKKWNGSYALDSEFVDLVYDKMIPNTDKPFYTFFTTFSTHGPYSRGGINFKKFQDLGYYEKLYEAQNDGLWENVCKDEEEEIRLQIEYLTCAMMDFDVALGKLVSYLKEVGKYDNTIFMLYGDHDAYYKSNEKNPIGNYVYKSDELYYPNKYQTIMVLSNPNLHAYYENKYLKTSYDNFVSPYIIVPTLLDILGIDYDENNYLGTSIFKTSNNYDNIFYSHELGFYMTDKIISSSFEVIEYNLLDDDQINIYLDYLQIIIKKIYNFDNIYKNGGFI